ncbi:hypothetical protein KR018_001358, partial [Drosophila ironensis]
SGKSNDSQTMADSFFDVLWPLILDENTCRIESEREDFFEPKQPFNKMKWHRYLADVGFPSYMTPHELRCCAAAKREEAENEENQMAANREAEERKAQAQCDFLERGSQDIRPVDQEVVFLRQKQERRQKLAYDFANRRYPWTMQTPSHELGFEVTEQLEQCFKHPMEFQILQDIHDHSCRLMILDIGRDVTIADCHRWIKFRPYIQMLALVRTPLMERSVQLLNVFHTLQVEESAENSWHDELICSLRAGFIHAQKMGLMKSCGQPLVYVFCRYRGICVCDTYKILRHT